MVIKDENGNDVEKKYVAGNSSSTDLDLHGDRMDPSAIKTMADSLHYHIIKLNAEHDTSWQSELGDVTDLTVTDNNELYMEAELNAMSKSQDLWYALTTLNKKLGLSIGGYVKEYEMVKEESTDPETGEPEAKWVRHYKNIQLDHIAVTSSPANPKTWVGAIAKSIQEDSAMLAKKLELEERYAEEPEETKEPVKDSNKSVGSEEATLSSQKERNLKEVAKNIVKMVQSMEADLLLELTYSGLHILSENQVTLLSKLFNAERGTEMQKDISLEAEEALKADTETKPEGDVVETPATLENESKEEAPAAEAVAEEPVKAEEPAPAEEAPRAEEAPVTEVAEEKPAEEKPAEAEEESEESSGVEEGKTEEPAAPAESEAEKPAEEESAEKTEDKSITEGAELLKSIQDLTGKMTEVLKTNESLSKRIQELEAQPASRKTVELEKGVGDDDTQPTDVKSLKAEMEEKIAQTRKDYHGNPNLFAMVQKIRAEYSRKIQEQN
jgi:hypothetical protein